MNKHLASLIALFITWSGSAMAQDVASADVNIVSVQAEMTKGDQFVCTAVINNQNDDDSRGTKVVVLLPLQVTIIGAGSVGGAIASDAGGVGLGSDGSRDRADPAPGCVPSSRKFEARPLTAS